MLGGDETDALSLLLVKNVSECNMVLKVEGRLIIIFLFLQMDKMQLW